MQPSEVLASEIMGGGLHNGWPDFYVGSSQDRPIVMEVKLGGKAALTKTQKLMRDVLFKHGFIYYLMRVYPDQTFGIFKWSPSSPYSPWVAISFKTFSNMHIGCNPRFAELDRHGVSAAKPMRCSACGWIAGVVSSHKIKTADGGYWEYCPECGEMLRKPLGCTLRVMPEIKSDGPESRMQEAIK